MKKEINPVELDFLLRYPSVPNSTSPGNTTILNFIEVNLKVKFDMTNLLVYKIGRTSCWKTLPYSRCAQLKTHGGPKIYQENKLKAKFKASEGHIWPAGRILCMPSFFPLQGLTIYQPIFVKNRTIFLTIFSVDFISNTSWGAIKTLAGMDEFRNLDRDIENNSKRWRKFVEAEAPEKEKFPQVWNFF